MPNTAACCLCGQIHGDPASDLIARLLPDAPYARRVLLETESFAVIPDVGPVAEGHVLLCPKPHVRSFAQLPAHAHGEFARLKDRLRALLTATFGGHVHLFEHGVDAGGDRLLCTIDHAHMHFVPLPADVTPLPLPQESWTEFDGSLGMLGRLSAGREYLLYEPPGGVPRVHVMRRRELESQYMRRVVAEALAAGTAWNWRESPRPWSADLTWRRCSASAGIRPDAALPVP